MGRDCSPNGGQYEAEDTDRLDAVVWREGSCENCSEPLGASIYWDISEYLNNCNLSGKAQIQDARE